jgi:site-specific DNA-methyltransferase (adenine-specific)
MSYQILQGDNRETLKTLADNSVDAIVTDPPYGIDFLGKSWDANTGALETYQECLRVLKPGGHILAFSAARTYHHLAVTLEQAGFEIRDQIMWIYSSGFPKSQDVGRQLHKKLNGKPDKQRFDPAIMIKVNGDTYTHPDTGKVYRALPDINGDRLKVAHEGDKYGTVYEEVIEVDNEWSGWGTCLKPAHEPIALARKPIKGSIKDNVLKHGVGALNIDATRIPYANEADLKTYINNIAGPLERSTANEGDGIKMFEGKVGYKVKKGTVKRLPSAGNRTSSFHNATGGGETQSGGDGSPEFEANPIGRFPSNVLGEIPDYQKYFYCPKVTRRERHIGFDPNSQGVIIDSEVFGKTPVCLDCGLTRNGSTKHDSCDPANIGFQERRTQRSTEVGNNHPTVKPIELMKYLIKLITPPGGTVLDPFNGSGSTGCAAVALGHEYIGCELDPAYVEISKRRIEQYNKSENNFDALFE